MTDHNRLDQEITTFMDHYLVNVIGRTGHLRYTEDSYLAADLGLDSLDFIGLLSELEQRWNLTISDEDMTVERFATIGAVRSFIRQAMRHSE